MGGQRACVHCLPPSIGGDARSELGAARLFRARVRVRVRVRVRIGVKARVRVRVRVRVGARRRPRPKPRARVGNRARARVRARVELGAARRHILLAREAAKPRHLGWCAAGAGRKRGRYRERGGIGVVESEGGIDDGIERRRSGRELVGRLQAFISLGPCGALPLGWYRGGRQRV